MSTWGDFGGTLGSLLAYEGDFGILWGQFRSTLESLWTSEGDFGQPRGYFGITLGVLLTYEGDFGMTLGHFGVTLGSLGGHFGSFWGDFAITLRTHGSLCGHFGYMRLTLESLWSIFKKHSFSQLDFNDFIYSSYHFGIDLGSFGGHFGVIFGRRGDFGTLSEPFRRRKA